MSTRFSKVSFTINLLFVKYYSVNIICGIKLYNNYIYAGGGGGGGWGGGRCHLHNEYEVHIYLFNTIAEMSHIPYLPKH